MEAATRLEQGPVVAGAGGLFLLFLVLGGGGAFLAGGLPRAERVRQPVVFDHRLHVDQEGLECSACHAGCDSGVESSLPDARACVLCHAELQGTSAAELELVQLLQEGRALAWEPLFRQPPHVFFSHRRHVTVARIECAVCHGAIAERTSPPERRSPLTMDQCLACHERESASTDCTGCHR